MHSKADAGQIDWIGDRIGEGGRSGRVGRSYISRKAMQLTSPRRLLTAAGSEVDPREYVAGRRCVTKVVNGCTRFGAAHHIDRMANDPYG